MVVRCFILGLLPYLATCGSPQKPSAYRNGGEGGFWQACYDEEGEIIDVDGNCEDPREITWALPIRVYVPKDYPARKATLQAFRVWNEWIGTDVFTGTENSVGVDVTMIAGGVNPMVGGRATPSLVNGRQVFAVELFSNSYDSTSVVVHELGHVLGLAHDIGHVRSIMHPGSEWFVPWLSQHDCRALARKYHVEKPPCVTKWAYAF